MNAKQRKQAETIRAAALAGLEAKQETVARQIDALMALKAEQEWYEKGRTAKAHIEHNERLLARLDQHKTVEESFKELAGKNETLVKLYKEVEEREDKLSLNMERFKENVDSEQKRLEDMEKNLEHRRNLVEIANKPVKESIGEILMMLELDESPEEIARLIRNKHHILVPTW